MGVFDDTKHDDYIKKAVEIWRKVFSRYSFKFHSLVYY